MPWALFANPTNKFDAGLPYLTLAQQLSCCDRTLHFAVYSMQKPSSSARLSTPRQVNGRSPGACLSSGCLSRSLGFAEAWEARS